MVNAMSEPETLPEQPLSRLREGEGQPAPAKKVPETGGPPGPEPTRYGDWERNGRCIDF